MKELLQKLLTCLGHTIPPARRPPGSASVSGVVRLFERGVSVMRPRRVARPRRPYRPVAREAAAVPVCRRGLLAVLAVWGFGLLAPCAPAAALELPEDPAWRERNTPILISQGTGPVAAPAAPDREEVASRGKGGVWGFRRGDQELGLVFGYGYEIDSSESNKSEMLKNLEFTMVRPRWGIFVTDRIGEGIMEGHLEFMVEPAFVLSTTPTHRTGYELSVLFRYHFATESRWVPFLTFGAGVIEENFKGPGRPSAGFNFTPQIGPGLSYLLSGNMAVSLEWRFYHISNANIDTPNVGLNVGMWLLGVSMFF